MHDISIDNAAGVCQGIVAATLDGKSVDVKPLRPAMAKDGATDVLKVTLGGG